MPPNPAAGPLPFVRRKLDRRVDQPDIEDQPEGEAGSFDERLAHVEGVDDLPRDVYGEAQQRHAVGLCPEAPERHEDIRRVPEEHADSERDRRQRHDPVGYVGWGHVAGAHDGLDEEAARGFKGLVLRCCGLWLAGGSPSDSVWSK